MMSYNLLNSPHSIFLLSCLFLWVSYRWMAKTHDTLEQAKRYAFCNRTGGGAIRFRTCVNAERDLPEAISV